MLKSDHKLIFVIVQFLGALLRVFRLSLAALKAVALCENDLTIKFVLGFEVVVLILSAIHHYFGRTFGLRVHALALRVEIGAVASGYLAIISGTTLLISGNDVHLAVSLLVMDPWRIDFDIVCDTSAHLGRLDRWRQRLECILLEDQTCREVVMVELFILGSQDLHLGEIQKVWDLCRALLLGVTAKTQWLHHFLRVILGEIHLVHADDIGYHLIEEVYFRLDIVFIYV